MHYITYILYIYAIQCSSVTKISFIGYIDIFYSNRSAIIKIAAMFVSFTFV